MKFRLHANSIRLRLSRSETDQLLTETPLIATTQFSPQHALTCRLELANTPHITAHLHHTSDGTLITITLPRLEAKTWAANTTEGLYAEQPNATTTPLAIAIEKDFSCLHPHNPAENTDTFPNPAANK